MNVPLIPCPYNIVSISDWCLMDIKTISIRYHNDICTTLIQCLDNIDINAISEADIRERLDMASHHPLQASDITLSIGGEMDDNLFKCLSFSDGHTLVVVASESNRYAKRKRLHAAATFGTANLNDEDGYTRAVHV